MDSFINKSVPVLLNGTPDGLKFWGSIPPGLRMILKLEQDVLISQSPGSVRRDIFPR